MNVATINEAGKKTNIPASRIRKWVKIGIVPGFFSGNRFYVNVDKFLEMVQAPEFIGTTKDLTAYIRNE